MAIFGTRAARFTCAVALRPRSARIGVRSSISAIGSCLTTLKRDCGYSPSGDRHVACAAGQERADSALQRTITPVQAGGSLAGRDSMLASSTESSGSFCFVRRSPPPNLVILTGELVGAFEIGSSPRSQLNVHRSFPSKLWARCRSSGRLAPLRRRTSLQHNRLPNAVPPCQDRVTLVHIVGEQRTGQLGFQFGAD